MDAGRSFSDHAIALPSPVPCPPPSSGSRQSPGTCAGFEASEYAAEAGRPPPTRGLLRLPQSKKEYAVSNQLASTPNQTHVPASRASEPVAGEGGQAASPAQVRDWMQSGGAVLVDVREPDEHARERIPGAHLVPLGTLNPRQLEVLAGPGQRLVLHCRGGRRSEEACRAAASLSARGIPLFSMSGGIEAWKQQQLPTEVCTTVSRLSIMRQVQLVVGLGVLAGSALAWLVHPAFLGLTAFFGAGLAFAGASGTCALASLLALMPWNKASAATGSCSSGRCS